MIDYAYDPRIVETVNAIMCGETRKGPAPGCARCVRIKGHSGQCRDNLGRLFWPARNTGGRENA